MRGSLGLAVLICLGFAAQSHAQGLPYPAYSVEQIKGIGAEPRDQWLWSGMIGNRAGGTVTNIPWSFFQPSNTTPPCAAGQEEYQGSCYSMRPEIDALVKTFSDQGVMVTGILVLPPSWAAWTTCNTAATPFCEVLPIWPGMFGRFAGYIAHRYNGLNGHGRIVNFIVHNEVNIPSRYLNGCTSCTISQEVGLYAASYINAYDAIKREQAAAKVLVPLAGIFDGPDAPQPGVSGVISIKTYISQLVPMVGARELKIALHAYGTGFTPVFSPDDSPFATLGMLGRVTGWLRQSFPGRESIYEVHLTEQGLSSDLTPGSEAAQADWLCQAFQNVLGTPGVESYLYTPATTHAGYDPRDHEELVYCALDTSPNPSCVPGTERYRPSWAVWALANRNDLPLNFPGRRSCGFELGSFTKLSRYVSPRGHFATTRLPPAGSTFEGAWKLLRYQQPGTHLLSECLAASGTQYTGPHTLIDTGTCGTLTPMGPLGYAYDTAGPGRVPLHRCYVTAPGFEDHFIQTDNCGGWSDEGIVGWVLPF